MDIDKFTDLPDWDDERFTSEDDEGEDWKPNPTREGCKALFTQWQQVVFLLKGITAPYTEIPDETMLTSAAHTMFMDSHIVGAKIMSSEAGGIYICRMENAAFIRQMAQSIASALLLFLDDADASNSHIEVVRNEIAIFRKLFIAWVNTFEKDEFKDEWGLFV